MRVRFELIGLRTVPKVESSSHVPASPNPSNGPGPNARPRVSPPQECHSSRSTRRSELISKIHAAGGLMGNDHILSLRTAPAESL